MPLPKTLALIRARYTPFGGAERITHQTMQTLAAQGVDVSMLARTWPHKDKQVVHDSADCVRINPFYVGRLWRDWGFSRAVSRYLEQHVFDVVQTHERIPGVPIYRAGDGVHRVWLDQRARFLGGKTHLAYLQPWHRYVLRTEKHLFEHPKLRAVVCNAQFVADQIQKYFSINALKLHVIRNGVDHAHFSPEVKQHRQAVRRFLGIGKNTPCAVFVGSGFARKGLGFVFEALSTVQDIHCLVVGHDRQAKHYYHLGKQLGVQDRVHYLGACKDVRPFLGAADVFVLPSLYDPLPNAALEAMACGLPVLTSPYTGVAELIKVHIHGEVCALEDKQAWAQALGQACDAEWCTQAGLAARELVLSMTPQAELAQWLALYRSLG